MKNKIQKLAFYTLAIFITSLTSCKVGMTSSAKGKANEAYLSLVENQTKYPEGVKVIIDNNQPFLALVNKVTKMKVRSNVYTIPTGRHTITIKFNDLLLLQQEIFTSSQETKEIRLP